MTAEEIARLKANYQRQPQKYTLEFLSYLIQIQDFEQVCSILEPIDDKNADNIMHNYRRSNKQQSELMNSFYLSIINTNDIKFVSDCFNAPLLDRLLLRMYPQAKIKSLKQVIDSDNPELFMMVLDKVIKQFDTTRVVISPIKIIGESISKYIFKKHAWDYLDKILENHEFAEYFFQGSKIYDIIEECTKSCNHEGLKKIAELGIFSNKEYYIDGALEFAAQKDLETFEFMLELGADIQSGKNQGALLHLATKKEWGYIFDLIERYSIDLSHSKLIFMAAQYGDIDVIEKLVSLGADLFFKTSEGINAIHYALRSRNIDNLNYLLSKGVEVDTSPECRTSLLFEATYSLDLLKQLQEKLELPLNVVDQSGDTLLHKAAILDAFRGGNLDLVKYLILRGLDVNAQNQSGLTALTKLHKYFIFFSSSQSEYEKLYQILEFLLNNNADPNIMIPGYEIEKYMYTFHYRLATTQKEVKQVVKDGYKTLEVALIFAICDKCNKEFRAPLLKLLIDHGAMLDKCSVAQLLNCQHPKGWDIIEYTIDHSKFYDKSAIAIILNEVWEVNEYYIIYKLFDKNYITVQDLQEMPRMPIIYSFIMHEEFQAINWLFDIGYDIEAVLEQEFDKERSGKEPFFRNHKTLLASLCLLSKQQLDLLQENSPDSTPYIETFKQIFAGLQEIFVINYITENNEQKKLLIKFLPQLNLSYNDSKDLEKIYPAALEQFRDFLEEVILSESIKDAEMSDETVFDLNGDPESEPDLLAGENPDSDAV